jgi:hypothetical protein
MFVSIMGAVDEQEIEDFDKDENANAVYRYIRYIDRIEVDSPTYAFFATIYKDGTFDFKTKGRRGFGGKKIDLNEKHLEFDKKYDYYSVKDFMERNVSNKTKFSYLDKMTDELFDIANEASISSI